MKSGYIAVIAGTTESRAIIEELLEEKKEIVAFVATDLGTQMLQNYNIEIVEGRKNRQQFLRFFKAFKPSKIYDASHPFADEVTKNIQDVCMMLSIPYERVARKDLSYDYDRIVYVKDVKEAIEQLKEVQGNILLTTGVKTAGDYFAGLNPEKLFIRVLKRGSSVDKCLEIGYEPSHVFGEDPPFSVDENEALIQKIQASVLVTKDSGIQGGVPEKVEAAKRCGIPVLMIKRPEASQTFPRVLIAAAGSGSGKTTVTLGLMQAFADRGINVQGYKCGPDYIDPMYHKRLTRRASINLDPIFHKEQMEEMLMKYAKGADIGVIEGVMGFYDGKGSTITGSTYEVASHTKTPTILVISVKGIANTVIPLIQGILAYQENTIQGVILNHCSKGYFGQIAPKIEEECGISIVGYLPENPEIRLQSRHLGLCMADEMENWQEYLAVLKKQISDTIDIDKVYEIAKKAESLKEFTMMPKREETFSIAVAMDEAFCFYYEDNLQMLKERGVKLVPFSPLHDTHLPKDIQGIYLGGGYPELFADELEKNKNMRTQIKEWCQAKKAILAECGGYMYLGESIKDKDGCEYSMCGAFPHKTEMGTRLNMHFGYVTLSAKHLCNPPIQAHEFHYSKEIGEDFNCIVEKNENRSWTSGYVSENQYAAYPHLPFRGNEAFLKQWLDQLEGE